MECNQTMDVRTRNLPKEFIVQIDDHPYITYAGLLYLAHEAGIKSIVTHLLQIPAYKNSFTAIVRASVVMKNGEIFTDIGDASHDSIGDPRYVPHLIRCASTRAKSRALRDALNVGIPSIEEMALEPNTGKGQAKENQKAATEKQIETLHRLADRLKMSPQQVASLASLSCKDASSMITQFGLKLKELAEIEKSRGSSQQTTAVESIH